MPINAIKIGDRLEITASRPIKNAGVSFVSTVEEILGPYLLLVQMPISYGKLIKLPQDQNYTVLFFTEKGMMKFSAIIEAYAKQSGFYMMKMKLTNAGERTQRRNYFRFDCALPITFAGLSNDVGSADTEEDLVFSEGVTKDLAGGGIRFVSNDNVEAEKLQCFLELGDHTLMLICKVLQKQHFPKSNYAYQYRADFIGISPNEREIIIQFIFSEQSKMIQRLQK